MVARARKVRHLQRRGEGERSESSPGSRQGSEVGAARARAAAEQVHEPRGQVGDLAMAQRRVGRIAVEEGFDLHANRVRDLCT